jgi:broad specificity phosphatase PhoE
VIATPVERPPRQHDDNVTLILVRHGHVDGIDPPSYRGQRELPLTPLGQRQAKALSRRIVAEWQPGAVFTSALGRCVETAKAIAKPFDLTPEVIPGLIDINYGAWQGMTDVEVRARWPDAWALWHHSPQFAEFPGGETMPAFVKRATNALHAILHAQRGHTVVIVTHDSVNRVLLLHALDLPVSHYRTLAQAPCALNALVFDRGQFTVRSVNETGHLLGL